MVEDRLCRLTGKACLPWGPPRRGGRAGTRLELPPLGPLLVRNVARVFDTELSWTERPYFSQAV